MIFSPAHIANITGGELIVSAHAQVVTQVALDSRKLSAPSASVYVAIAGERHDGHRFVREVYQQGVRVFITEKPCEADQFLDATVVRVSSAVAALQALAAHHRRQFHIPVIGITGSNGKTTVKEWLNLLLADDFTIVRSPKSYNSQVGVPQSVLLMEPYHTLGIFEAGISQPGEMEVLEKVIQPTLGVFTNVGMAHRENFSSSHQVGKEKALLFTHAHEVVCSADAPEIAQALAHRRCTTWSYTREADVRFTLEAATAAGAEVRIEREGQEAFHVSLSMSDQASLENAACCITVLLHLGYSPEVIARRVQRVVPIPMRMEVLQGVGNAVIINDTYSNDLHSLEIALDFARRQNPGQRHVAVLSDAVQSGIADEERHHAINAMLASRGVSELFAIGEAFVPHLNVYTLPVRHFQSVEVFMSETAAEAFARSVVLVKGARELRFERIVQFLQEQTHDTVLHIDLDAMAHNLHYFRSQLSPGVKLMAMVKAFGYGAGSHEVASLLEFNKADYLAVAYTDEGVALRKSGISLPIMVMNPEKSSLESLVRHHLEPEVYSFRTLDQLLAALPAEAKAYPIHLKLDTGMHRLGFGKDEVEELAQRLAAEPRVRVVSVFTHLAAADEPKHDGFTQKQLHLFEQSCTTLRLLLGYDFMRHAGNTGGIQRFAGAQYDMVRLGIGLYGVSAAPEHQSALREVSSLRTVVSQLRDVPAGDSIGYGRSFIAEQPMRIAIIPVGYADGLRRSLSNGVGEVLINDVRCPIVGRVCMDMTMIDVSGVAVQEGDAVVIFGAGISLSEFAQKCGTIAYEVLTSVPQRVKRVYLQE